MAETVSTSKQGPAIGRGRANLANYRVMKRIEVAIERQGISLREIGRRMDGRANATRVREYLRQQKVPGPAVLGSLAAAVGISPIEAQWDAGRHEYVLHYLQALYELGWWWMRTDRVSLDRDSGALFYGHHRSRPGPNGIRIGKAPTAIPAVFAERYHGANLHNDAGVFRTVTLPKPMACALLLAIGLFPRRGDRVRPQTLRFVEQLGLIAFGYTNATERRRVPAGLANLERPLVAANDVLQSRFYSRHARFAIVGEYIHSWADFVCAGYSQYARLALYETDGAIGNAAQDDNVRWLRADFPNIADF